MNQLQKIGAVEVLEAELLAGTHITELPLKHSFAPGIYIRTIAMPAGMLVIGHEHKTEHHNVVLTGRALVWMEGHVEEIIAPAIFISKPGVRKVLLIGENMEWATIHANPENETDQARLTEMLIVKSRTFKEHQAAIDSIKTAASNLDSEPEKLCLG